MAETDIEWCYTVLPDGRVFKGYSGNPWIGCCKVSPGCKACYAEHDTPARVLRARGLEVWGQKAPRPEVKGFWQAVPRWDRRAAKLGVSLKHFLGSNCDVFEGRADLDPLRARLWTLLENTPHLTHIFVTKRPENVMEMVPRRWLQNERPVYRGDGLSGTIDHEPGWPRNVWLLTSVEDQRRAEERIPELLRIPAPLRGVSAEPLLEEVDLSRWLNPKGPGCAVCFGHGEILPSGAACPTCGPPRLDWVIVGGESGPGARPFDLAWARSLVQQCGAAGVPVFVKQMGARPGKLWRRGPSMPVNLDPHLCAGGSEPDDEWEPMTLNDKKGGDPAEWPADLRIRQWPEVRHG